MDGEIPAEATTEAPQEATTETPAAVAPEATPASETVATEAPRAAEPDIASLLNDEEALKQILKHERIAKEIEHRASSEAGRRAKALADADRARANAEAEAKRLREMDEYDLGKHVKETWQVQEEQQKVAASVFGQFTNALYAGAVQGQEALTEEDRAALHPLNFGTPVEWATALASKIAERQVAQRMAAIEADLPKRAKALALAEAEAIVQERLKEHRAQAAAPVVLPAAEAGSSDSEFAAAYGSGKSNDTARQIDWMRKHGVL